MTIKSTLAYLPRKLKKRISFLKNKKSFKSDYVHFLKEGKTTEEAYQRMIQLYCASNGKFNEDVHENVLSKVNGLDSKLSQPETPESKAINDELKRDGYVVMDKKISETVCNELTEFASVVSCRMDGSKETLVYDKHKPVAPLYRLQTDDIMNSEVVQNLIMDPELINIARNYFGCEPIFDFPAMWWSTSFSKEASSDGAQLYHFDMDRIKWLKVFFYLTDVDQNNGPHCYIAASHKIGNKPQHLLDRGYVRVPDIDLRGNYKDSDFKVLEGKKGTIFFGDTKCWHKGKPLVSGYRLVLEFQYTSSLFGMNFTVNCSRPSEKFKSFLEENKVYASNIALK